MESAEVTGLRRAGRMSRQRIRAERIETALIVALAGLVFLKGAPAIVGIALGIGEMMMALMRL